ncbi:MAG: hypothetical protein EPO63_04335 [Candidatus Nitrosotenuis sp.]|nr:MAG: hypothetical protein EPO63_04335 [Candidatus Nitrosotenuis sp.]
MMPLIKGILFGVVTITAYLGIVVVTTPALDPISAASAAIQLNSIIIVGMGIGVGIQSFLSEYSKRFGCSLAMKRRAIGGNSGSTAITSFFSFFSLVPLGCCGWWLYVISFLPSIFGTGLSAALINYSQPLSYVGLAIIYGFNLVTYYKIREKQKQVNFN